MTGGRRGSSTNDRSGHMAPNRHMEANQEQAVITLIPKGEKRIHICRPFHIHRMGKLIIDVRPDMSIAPQGIVACSVTPCLILNIMISVAAQGKDLP